MLDHHPIVSAQPTRFQSAHQAGQRQREEQEKLLREFELRRRIRSTVVPTDDVKVRTMLRALGEPFTLFGEKEVSKLSAYAWCPLGGCPWPGLTAVSPHACMC